MKYLRLTHRRTRRGYTLVELLAAIVVIAILAGFAMAKWRDRQEQVRVNAAIMQLQTLQMQLALLDPLPASLAEIGRADMRDPWGNLYVYNRFTQFAGGVPVGARRDRNLRPINADFDLYSVGKDGASTLALTASNSQDDVVVANDGKFVGLAKDY